ncbi:MAG: hypothetical protein JO287_13155 [Pseudonocardiales bacterium]|nr:hypothetical protein [Pseudonocardiales bacterium]
MTTGIVIVIVIGVSVIILVGGLGLILIARLRRAIKSQFDTIDNLLETIRADQRRDEPGGPP